MSKMLKLRVIAIKCRWEKMETDLPTRRIMVVKLREIIEGSASEQFCQMVAEEEIISLVGTMPRFVIGKTYVISATLDKDPKWGLQLTYQGSDLDFDISSENKEEQKKFFKFFLTERQIGMLYDKFDNPIELLKNKDIKALSSIKGIGEHTAERMCEKYTNNVSNSYAFAKLSDLNLTKRAIENIISQVGSAETAVAMIKTNPYNLIKFVRGYGWNKADALAQQQGLARDSKERCLAYGFYCLEQQADSGNSAVSFTDWVNSILQMCAPVTQDLVIQYLREDVCGQAEFDQIWEERENGINRKENPSFFYSKAEKKISLFKYRLMEKEIAAHLKRLKEAPSTLDYDKDECLEIIHKVEREQGYQFTHEQMKAIWMMLDNNVSILTGPAGCVDCDTEFFNGTEWKKISDYDVNDKVLAYGEDGIARLETPERYIKLPCDKLWLTQTKYGIDMCTCEEHNVYYITSKGDLYHQPFAKIKEMHETSNGGFSGKFITSFGIDRPGIDLSDAQIKVMLAVIADGSFIESFNNTYCKIHIKEEHKKNELRSALREAGIAWKERESANAGDIDFYLHSPRREEQFTPKYWYNCSQHQLEVICQNTLKWEGSTNEFHCSFVDNKVNAEFIQYAFSACGYRAVLTEREAFITKRNLISMKEGSKKVPITPYETKDGYKYCFTVSSHMWVMRRNGKIIVTGNCGKSSTVKPVIEILQHYNKEIAQTALSGRAASVLTEYTGLEGKTIHRLLGLVPSDEDEGEGVIQTVGGELTEDVVILDESSMVGEDLFVKLASSLKSGARLIMLGDVNQLPPISIGNLLGDCMSSGYVPVTALTIIHRQALKSGIISQSAKVREGASLVKRDFEGTEIRGELQDFKLECHANPMVVHAGVLDEFKRLLEKGIPSEDIQILVPVRTRGINSCRYFNEEIQELVNPEGESYTIEVRDGSTIYNVSYRKGDKVMITKNDYSAKKVNGKTTAIFNGNMGYVTSIDRYEMQVKLDSGVEVVIPKAKWWDLTHAWAVSTHKSQGSQFNHVLIGLDSGAYTMLSKEWVYTAITRARKSCYLAAQPQALNTATRTSEVKLKQTWLRNDLHTLFLEEHK